MGFIIYVLVLEIEVMALEWVLLVFAMVVVVALLELLLFKVE